MSMICTCHAHERDEECPTHNDKCVFEKPKAPLVKKLFCTFCDEPTPATVLAPQDNGADKVVGRWSFEPICAMHLDGWWDGSDVPEDERPDIIDIPGGVA